jgi:hypothetical protein
VVPGVSKDCGVFIFRVQLSKTIFENEGIISLRNVGNYFPSDAANIPGDMAPQM